MKEKETITITIETTSDVMLRIKRLLAWLHFNSSWGHSGTVAMSLDGDGWDKVKISGLDFSEYKDYVHHKMMRTKDMKVEYAGEDKWSKNG